MSSPNPLNYIWCPYCGRNLETKLEEGKQKKYCRECKWTHHPAPHIAVAGVMTSYETDGEPYALMVKRNREPFKNTWMFPAGFLEFGEHPVETLLREMKEETGLRVTSFDIMAILKAIDDPRSPDHLVMFYRINAIGDIKNNDLDENSSIQLKPIHGNIDVGFPHHRIILTRLRKYLPAKSGKGAKQ